MIDNDINVDDFCDVLSLLEPDTPLCTELDCWGSPYKNQKAHCLSWFSDQTSTGSGAYTRSKSNSSAKKSYNRLLNPGMLIWMAETLGANASDIELATSAALEAEKQNWRKRCAAFRAVISFDYILNLLNHPDNWIYDKQIESYLTTDKKGFRQIKLGKKRKVEEIIIKECT